MPIRKQRAGEPDEDYAAYLEANREKERARKRAYEEANREKERARKRAHYEANREKERARLRAYLEANREKVRARSRAHYEANREKERARSRAHGKGISHHVVMRLLALSGGVCGVCGRSPPQKRNGSSGLVIDHHHGNRIVRGVLCDRCNIAIGYVDAMTEDPAWFDALVAFSNKHKDPEHLAFLDTLEDEGG